MWVVVGIDKKSGCRKEVKNCVDQEKMLEVQCVRDKGLSLDVFRGLCEGMFGTLGQ